MYLCLCFVSLVNAVAFHFADGKQEKWSNGRNRIKSESLKYYFCLSIFWKYDTEYFANFSIDVYMYVLFQLCGMKRLRVIDRVSELTIPRMTHRRSETTWKTKTCFISILTKFELANKHKTNEWMRAMNIQTNHLLLISNHS